MLKYRTMKKQLILTFITIMGVISLSARDLPYTGGNKSGGNGPVSSAGCDQPQR